MPTSPVWFEFVETKAFTKRLVDFGSREVLLAIQADLIENPIRWPVIRGTHGTRKGRVSDPGRREAKAAATATFICFFPTSSASISCSSSARKSRIISLRSRSNGSLNGVIKYERSRHEQCQGET